LKIISIEVVPEEDFPPAIRAKFNPAQPREERDVDFYDFQRALERKNKQKDDPVRKMSRA
jgi:hypothetical protein